MYESPIEFFTKTVAPKIAAEIDEKALEAVFQCGFNVDRDELEKALRYDRDQWRKGFDDGVEYAQPKWISVKEQPEPTKDGEYWCYGYWLGSGRKQCETAEYLGEWKIVNNFILTHWMPLPEPPKEE